MDRTKRKSKLSLLMLISAMMVNSTGCTPFTSFFEPKPVIHSPVVYETTTAEAIHGIPANGNPHVHQTVNSVPNELNMVSLAPYVLEPPDVLQIDAIRLIPKSPYSLQPMDVLQVVVDNALQDSPIQGLYPIDTSGRLNLGALYGSVKVDGLNVSEASAAVEKHLRSILESPRLSLTLAQTSGEQQIVGEHLLGLDGTVNLGTYGRVYVAGMTIPQARAAIEKHLSQFISDPKISVDIFQYQSKAYYLVVEGANNGDQVQKGIITGNETVLSVIANAGGLSQISSKRIWIARPGPRGAKCDKILPVSWNDITKGGSTKTNYQVLPGDRIFVAEDRLVATTVLMSRVITPIERVFGFLLLGGQTVQGIQRFPEGSQQF